MFLKVYNIEKLSSKQFHSLIEDGIHDFCEIQVLFKGTEIFLLFLRGYSEVLITRGGIKPRIYKGTMPALTLYREFTLLPSL